MNSVAHDVRERDAEGEDADRELEDELQLLLGVHLLVRRAFWFPIRIFHELLLSMHCSAWNLLQAVTRRLYVPCDRGVPSSYRLCGHVRERMPHRQLVCARRARRAVRKPTAHRADR